MPSNVQGTTAREFQSQQIHYLRKMIDFNSGGREMIVGELPQGALILPPISGVQVITEFSATTATLDIGIDGDDVTKDADAIGTAINMKATSGDVGGLYRVDGADANMLIGDRPVTVTASATLTGGTNTAGLAFIVIAYLADNDR